MSPKHIFCGYCGREIIGRLVTHRCAVCGRILCPFCVRKKGAFLGIFGGYEVCPYCYEHESD
ncbi:MAG: hypothetical protein J7K68_04195 [Candidatus Diapherotrites archaeon]|nr:hypothetical protein [Candidatus Diapherotrites archaeon]